MALLLYRHDADAANPPDWTTLARVENELQLQVFRCPLSDLPELKDSLDPAYRAAALIRPEQSSYRYIGQNQTDDTPPNTITAYCLEHLHGNGTNVLFADGHVEWTTSKGLQALLDASTRPSIKE